MGFIICNDTQIMVAACIDYKFRTIPMDDKWSPDVVLLIAIPLRSFLFVFVFVFCLRCFSDLNCSENTRMCESSDSTLNHLSSFQLRHLM